MPPGYERVPTVKELASRGLAHMVGGTEGSPVYQIEVEGQRLLTDTMMRNGARGKEFDAMMRAGTVPEVRVPETAVGPVAASLEDRARRPGSGRDVAARLIG